MIETYLTPAQVIELYPDLKVKFGWNAGKIGLFYKSKLLSGYDDASMKKSYIKVSSLIELIQYVNKRLDGQKMKMP
jgi:hypothetical protein